jgi:hypothetical protein
MLHAPLNSLPFDGSTETQRPTFKVWNSSRVGEVGSVVYRFEISKDPSLGPVFMSATVPEGATRAVPGAASFTVFTPESDLPSGVRFFWHATAIDTISGVTSPSSTSKVPGERPWSFVTAPIVIQAPEGVSPARDSIQQTLRPTFIVRNAATAGQPPGRLVYRFEIATDAAAYMDVGSVLKGVVMSATVPEGAGQTSFTPSSNLAAGVTYFWHVQAIDPLTGSAGAFSWVSRFATVPAGGRPFVLAITAPSSCPPYSRNLVDNGRTEGILSQAGNSWHFFLPLPGSGDLVLDFTSDGRRLSGTIQGRTSHGPAVSLAQGGPVPITGSMGVDGRLSGTFDGDATVSHYNQFSDLHSCTGSGFSWTLSPSASP